MRSVILGNYDKRCDILVEVGIVAELRSRIEGYRDHCIG